MSAANDPTGISKFLSELSESDLYSGWLEKHLSWLSVYVVIT